MRRSAPLAFFCTSFLALSLVLAGCSASPASGTSSSPNGTGGRGGTPSAGGSSAPGGTSSTGQHTSVPDPFGLPGTSVTSSDHVAYTLYSGTTPSFDGLPLAADVTLPAHPRFPLPLVVMLHGWGQSRTAWESPTITNGSPNVSNWNNIAFAARGYAVLNYTARGWHDSCGPDVASAPDNQATLPAACTSRAYWVHLADPRWEIHDAQYLIGELVDEGVADPGRIGVTGDSYGGGQTWLLALLNNRVMQADGALAPWRSPKGRALHIAAAVPEYTWASLASSLLPNGRVTDTLGSDSETLVNPVGVPIQSYVTGLYADGPVLRNGFYAPPQSGPSADLTTWYARITAGNPYRDDATTDPVLSRALQELDIRSPLRYTPDALVPVFQIQGLTDPLFPPAQALMLRNKVLAWNARYPIKSFFGDVGHSNANNPADVWAAANARANAFFDYYLKGAGTRPTFDVTAMTTECVAGQSRLTFSAPRWGALATRMVSLTSNTPQATSNASAGPEGPATDPIVHSGCLSSQPTQGTGNAAWSFGITTPETLMGQPTLTLSFLATGVDEELCARLWDVLPDGTTETLLSRGTYRYLGTAGAAAQVSFQTSANAWQLQPGHTLRVEITGNDSPYYQADSVPSAVTVTALRVSLPMR